MTRTYDYIIIHFIQRHLSQIFYIETKGFLNWIVPYIFDKYGHKTLIVITHSNGQIPFKAHKPACTSCLMHTCIFWIDYSIHTTFECNLCGRSMWKVSKLCTSDYLSRIWQWCFVSHILIGTLKFQQCRQFLSSSSLFLMPCGTSDIQVHDTQKICIYKQRQNMESEHNNR